MDLQEIKTELINNGYVAHYRKTSAEFIVGGILDNETNIKLGTTFGIMFEEGEIILTTYKGQTPFKKSFIKLDDLVKEIKILFPIK